jgi:hypothetical protein
MRNSSAQLMAAERPKLRAPQAGDSTQPLGDLFAPLDFLLASGGDTRLRLNPADRLNGYGCSSSPRPQAFTFASTTATSISERAYMRAHRARQTLIEASLIMGLEEAFDARVEHMRCELKTYLELDASNAEIVFSPSGTDSQLHALFIARSLLGLRLVSIIAAADETGSGTVLSTTGRHFNTCTMQGTTVEKGAPVEGMAEDATSIEIPSRDEKGRVRTVDEIDHAVMEAVATAVGDGRYVLLHIMDRSKLGCRSPSQHCVRDICQRWPDVVQIVVDACQTRLGRARIAYYLDHGYMVLLTGSKFFTGAPFSGALLVPERLSMRLAIVSEVPFGLCDYTNRSDWPGRWQGIRSRLPARMNFGQWLRWEAALAEIQGYFAVPPSFRLATLQKFSSTVCQLSARSRLLELLPDQVPDPSDAIDDEEMSVRTIWPFIIRREGKALSPNACAKIYRALNRDVSSFLPPTATLRERQLAAQLCHVGQPVVLRDCDGGAIAALRISAGARIVSESWSPNEDVASENVRRELDQVATVLEKVEMLIPYLEAIDIAEPR